MRSGLPGQASRLCVTKGITMRQTRLQAGRRSTDSLANTMRLAQVKIAHRAAFEQMREATANGDLAKAESIKARSWDRIAELLR